MLLSLRTLLEWTGNSLSLYTLDSLLVEDMDMILSVKTWTLC